MREKVRERKRDGGRERKKRDRGKESERKRDGERKKFKKERK